MTQQSVDDVGAYHILDGVVAYSPLLTDGASFPTLQGERVHVTVADGDIYINAAKVIQRDFLTSNGVMHVLDSLLNPNDTSARPSVTPAASPTPAASMPPKPSPASGLSSGAKAGIGVGVAVACILLIAAGILFWRRRRTPGQRLGSPSEMPLSGRGNARELDPKSRAYELDAKNQSYELPAATDPRHEMESDTTRPSNQSG